MRCQKDDVRCGEIQPRAAFRTLYINIVAVWVKTRSALANAQVPAADRTIEGFRSMSAVTSTNPATNPGLADLLQNLTNTGSGALAATLSSPTIEAALEQAPPGDLVQLSDQALQLQVVGSLFGTSNTDAGAQTNSLFNFLDPALAASTSSNPFSGLETPSAEAANANSLLEYLDPALAGTAAANSVASGLSPTDSSALGLNNPTLVNSLFDLQA